MLAAEPLSAAGCGSVNVPPPCLRQPASMTADARMIKHKRVALFITCLSIKRTRPTARAAPVPDCALPRPARVQPLYRPRMEFLLRIFNNYLNADAKPSPAPGNPATRANPPHPEGPTVVIFLSPLIET